MPSAAELLAADPKVLRDSGFSARKSTLRALAQRFVDRGWHRRRTVLSGDSNEKA
jgi:3-methyladenine DNA glycosylase/8-oxoguanine DNA glycosylase